MNEFPSQPIQGDYEAKERFLLENLKSGYIEPYAVELAAYLGSLEAHRALGETPDRTLWSWYSEISFDKWVEGLGLLGDRYQRRPMTLLRAAVSSAWVTIPVVFPCLHRLAETTRRRSRPVRT